MKFVIHHRGEAHSYGCVLVAPSDGILKKVSRAQWLGCKEPFSYNNPFPELSNMVER